MDGGQKNLIGGQGVGNPVNFDAPNLQGGGLAVIRRDIHKVFHRVM